MAEGEEQGGRGGLRLVVLLDSFLHPAGHFLVSLVVPLAHGYEGVNVSYAEGCVPLTLLGGCT